MKMSKNENTLEKTRKTKKTRRNTPVNFLAKKDHKIYYTIQS